MNEDMLFKLIERFENGNIGVLEFRNREFRIRMERQSDAIKATPLIDGDSVKSALGDASVKSEVIDEPEYEIITSPIVGTFYRAPAPDAPPFVEENQVVKRGDILCIVEAMKLMNQIEAEFDCKIVEVLRENGEMVEYGTPLFKVIPVG